MKLSSAAKLLLLAYVAEAFAPAKLASRPSTTARSLVVDPSPLQDIFSSISLSDVGDAVDAVATAATDIAPAAADAADAAATQGNGWFGFLTGPTEGLLQVLHNILVGVGLKENSWGIAIITMTLVIKLVTFPLTKTQLESTNKMQALQPTIKELQAKYQSNPEVMNQKIAEIYQANDVNPLAGCLPSLVQIPVFIGLYRAVLDLAKTNALNEPFLFLPNLEGPVYGADPTQGSAWLFSNWVDGAPSLGWDDTIAFLVLPVFLVISQFVSMELMQPKGQDAAQQQSNAVLKVLPLMIGWFSLNVPAALCVYWVTNNIVTTATSLAIRSSMANNPVAVSSGASTSAPPPTPEAIFAPSPLNEQAVGFSSDPDVTPITGTSAIDAEIIDVEDGMAGEGMAGAIPSAPTSKKRGGKKKKRRKN